MSKKELKVYRTGHETVVHFNPEAVALDEDDFLKIGQEIYAKSGKRIFLVIDLSSHGILSLCENPVGSYGVFNIDLEDAEEILIEKIKKCG